MNNSLLIRNVGKRYGDTWVLRDIRATVPKGKITAFMGPNGAGKTTLFHIIAGALKPDKGSVIYKGEDISNQSPYEIARKGIGRQFQDIRIFRSVTALENVVAGMIPLTQHHAWRAWYRPLDDRRAEKAMKQEALHWLNYVGLGDEYDKLAGELSFGKQKLLSLARLFARGFDCLLLDEPTAGVSHQMSERITSLICKRVDEGDLGVAAFIEHNLSAVEHMADWIHFLNDGCVAFSGRGDHVLGHRAVREIYMGI